MIDYKSVSRFEFAVAATTFLDWLMPVETQPPREARLSYSIPAPDMEATSQILYCWLCQELNLVLSPVCIAVHSIGKGIIFSHHSLTPLKH